jgi:hypothetical protein
VLITKSKIRQIIREEARKALQEMPYAGSLGVRHSDSDEESFFASESPIGSNRKGAEKYAQSARFRNLAKKHFANIPYNVWVAPLIGVGAGVNDYVNFRQVRTNMVSLAPDGIRMLKDLGFNAPDQVGVDDVVILYTSMAMDKGFIATPWMIFHSMFDAAETQALHAPLFAKLADAITMGEETEDLPDPALEPLSRDDEAWFGALTMASARKGKIGATTDAIAEIMCQELLTAGGFQINDEGAEEEYIEALHSLKPFIKACADEFLLNIRGKLLIVSVN